MSPQQSSEITQALDESREAVLAAANASESLAAMKPAEGRWSALECLEHVTRVEESFLERLQPAQGEAPPVSSEREAGFAARMKDRSEKRQAPDGVRPTGKFRSMAEAIEAFKAVRERAIQFANDHAADVTSYTATSPRWGVMNGREVLLVVAGHSRRHAAQMREALDACEVAEALEQSRRELIDAASLPETLAAVRPAEGRWSAIECVEHVIFVEKAFLSRLEPAEGAAPPVDRGKEAGVMTRAIDRTSRFQAPEAIHPKGRFATMTEALQEFNAVRAGTAQFAREHADKLYSMAVTHPVLGRLNGKEALILIAAHSRRHALQMCETTEALAAR